MLIQKYYIHLDDVIDPNESHIQIKFHKTYQR